MNTRLPYFLILLVFTIKSSLSLADEKPIDMKDSKNLVAKISFMADFNLIFIKAGFAQDLAGWFIVDTGFDVNVIDKSFASLNSLHLSDEVQSDAPGGSINYSETALLPFLIDGIVLSQEKFIAIDLSHLNDIVGHNIAGIVGIEFLSKFVFMLDNDNKEISFFRNRVDDTDYTVLPFELIDNEPFIYAAMGNRFGQQVYGKLKLDTGSLDTLGFNKNFVEAAHLVDIEKADKITGVAVGGETQGIEFTLPYFQLANNKIESIPSGATIDSSGFENRDDSGTLGMEIIRRFNWLVDLKAHHIAIIKNKFYDTAIYQNISGITAAKNKSGQIVVYQVTKNSKADNLGVKKGDVISKINDTDAKLYSLSEIRELFGTELKSLLINNELVKFK